MKNFLMLILSGMLLTSVTSQDINMSTYDGDWEANIHPRALSHDIVFEKVSNNEWNVSMTNDHLFYNKKVQSHSINKIYLVLGSELSFIGKLSADQSKIEGFINTNSIKNRLTLFKNKDGAYHGEWNSFFVEQLNPAKLFLVMENGIGSFFESYPILPDNRYRGTYSVDFLLQGDVISFFDKNASYFFKGKLRGDTISMDMYLADAKVCTMEFIRSTDDWNLNTTAKSPDTDPFNPMRRDDDIKVKPFISVSENLDLLKNMSDSIEADKLTHMHSLLIAYDGNLVYENYFNGFHADLLHDQRSAAKSIGSAMIGIAIEDKLIRGLYQSIFDFIPTAYQYAKDPLKSKITLKHLLTMSSGLDAIDFGLNRTSQASEDVYQTSNDWLKTVLEASMLFAPGSHSFYGSANPFLLGVAIANQLEDPVEDYMHERLFNPLGISRYSLPQDWEGNPYFGGGIYLRPRDMLKFGELYKNNGIWNGNRILPAHWVEESVKNYMSLENTNDKNGYGYLFWHMDYDVNGQTVHAVECRGAGGQYISIIEELDLTIIITSGNYRNGRYWQPELVIKQYVLPLFIK